MALLAPNNASFWMPVPGSTTARDVDWVFNFILYIAVFFFVLIVALMVLFLVRYARRPGRQAEKTATHNTALEMTWSGIPLVLVIVIFYLGFKTFLNMATAPANAYKVNVTAQKWSWLFEYPNGHTDADLHVPVDRPIELVMRSEDVIHSLYIPAFRLKRDVVPGRYNKAWFHATQPGEFTIFCAEYCGTRHSDMLARCVVHGPGEFEKWLANADPLKRLTEEQYIEYLADPAAFIKDHPDLQGLETPVQLGARLFTRQGCAQCHTTDGRGGTGPTFKGLFAHSVRLRDGNEWTADENYIRESILEPQTQVVAGFESVMPTYKGRLKDREITALIEYIKSLED